MIEPTFEYKSAKHGTNLNDMRGNWCDITIIVNDTKYRAHKIVLAANLNYFKDKLLNSSDDSEKDVIDMTGDDVTDLAAFILYAYTGKILLSTGNALYLLKDAHGLKEDGIKEACITFLKQHLKAEDACSVYKYANTIGSVLLRDAAAANIIKNFEVCSQTADFLDFNYESLKKIFCAADSIYYKSQQILFEGIMRWIMHDVYGRRTHIVVLLSLIDITKLTAEYLMNYLENIVHRDDLFDIPKNLILCYRKSKSLKQKQSTLLILQYSNKKLGIQLYDFIGKKWSSLQNYVTENFLPDFAGSIFDSAVLDDQLYYVLGRGVFMYEFTTGLFRRINALGPLTAFSDYPNYNLCTCDKFLYLYRSRYGKNQLVRYDPQTFSAKELAPSELKHDDPCAALFYQNGIHVLGGIDEPSPRRTAIKYVPLMNEWEVFPSMREERRNHAVAVLDGKLYACGGLDKNSVEVYEPATEGWRQVASMNEKRHDFLVVPYEGKLFAIGGDTEKTIEVYDPSKDEWQIDRDASSGLQIEHPRGGLISDKCLQQRALKRPSEPPNGASSNSGADNTEVPPPSKTIKK